MRESPIQKKICEYLTQRGYSFWRQNTAGIYDEGRGQYRTPSKYAVSGVSDIILLSGGKAYFIEVKSDRGAQSEEQELFQELVERAGCEYLLARCLDDVIDAGF